MKKARIIETKKKEEVKDIEDTYSVKTLLLIVGIILVIFGIFYFITTLVVKPKEKTNKADTITVIDSTKIVINNLLDRKDSKYYVLATKESLYTDKANYIKIYDSYIKDYNSKEDHLPIYKTNLDDALNKNYIGNKTNITDDLSKLVLSDEVLFLIENGSIKNYYVGNEEIVKALSEL